MTFEHFVAGISYKWDRFYYKCILRPIGLVRWRLWKNKPVLMSNKQTLQHIIDTKCSICRYGDGEFNIAWGNNIGFQNNSAEMTARMNEVLNSDNPNILICLPEIFGDLKVYSSFTEKWWEEFRLTKLTLLKNTLTMKKIYGNTQITRFSDYKESLAPVLMPLYKRIWDKRDIVIVEGEKSRLGVGNDLFENTASIKRILAPAKDAYDVYNEIVVACCELIPKETLVIIALGPAATIMAYDLGLKGYQALDLGHIDIQYEYYIRGLDSKTPIPGKYVNEAGAEGQTVDDSAIDMSYLSQIIIKIKS